MDDAQLRFMYEQINKNIGTSRLSFLYNNGYKAGFKAACEWCNGQNSAIQINQQLVEALEKIAFLEGTESNEWDAVDRLIPEMCQIARAALAAAK